MGKPEKKFKHIDQTDSKEAAVSNEEITTRPELVMKISKIKQLIGSTQVRLNAHNKVLSKLRNEDEQRHTKDILAKLTSKILSDR